MEAERHDENIDTDKLQWLQLIRQINISLTIWCFYFLVGLSIGCLTVAISQIIKDTNTATVMNDEIFPWITSIGSYAGVCLVIVLTIFAHLLGRKKSIFVISISSFAASVFLYFSTNPTHIFFTQLIYAIPGAGQMTIYSMTLTEYTSTKYRGLFLTLKSASFFWGIWTANAIGIFSHYKYIGLLSLVCSSFCFTNGFFMPESPYWLASRGKYDECTEAHRWLKGEGKTAEKELQDLINLQKELRVTEKQSESKQNSFINYFRIIKQTDFYKPVLLCVLVFLVYHISGKLVCAMYAIEIMKEITDTESTAHIGVLILDGFSVLGMYIGCGVSKYVKRRTMLLVTATVGSTFLLLMSLYLYLVKISFFTENVYVIITLLVVYSLAICCGPAILATSICGELLPVKSRSLSICCTAAITMLIFGTIAKTTPLMFLFFEIHGTFLFFGLSSAICILIAYKYLPETKDKSIYEIAALFKPND